MMNKIVKGDINLSTFYFSVYSHLDAAAALSADHQVEAGRIGLQGHLVLCTGGVSARFRQRQLLSERHLIALVCRVGQSDAENGVGEVGHL